MQSAARETLLVRPGRELLGPGDWDRVFGRRAPLEVEIGFGRDEGILRRAVARPGHDFVGVELKRDRVDLCLRRAERLGVRNLRVLPGRAEVAVGVLLPAGRVSVLRVLFPDPWPKKRHAGNRLVQPWFAREARRLLAPGGRLLLATDDAGYASWMREVLGAAEGLEEEPEGTERTGEDGPTLFEKRGLAEGRAIARLAWRRRA